MVSVSKCAFIVHALLLALPVQAARGPGSELANSIFKNKRNLICGSGRIRAILTDGSSSARIRPWAQVYEVAGAYMKKQRHLIPKIKLEIDRLKEDLADALVKESHTELDQAAVIELLQNSIETPTTFKTHEIALLSQCGQSKIERRKNKVKPGAFQKSVDTFVDLCRPKLNGQVKASGGYVHSVCLFYMGLTQTVDEHANVNDDDTACDELCTQIGREAGQLTDTTAGHFAGSSKKIQQELDTQLAMLKEAQGELEECTTASQALNAFGEEVQGLDQKISEAFRFKEAAADALEEAEMDFDHGTEVQERMAKTLVDAEDYNKQAVEEKAKYTTALAEAHIAETKAGDGVSETKAAFEAARKRLDEASQASSDVHELRGLVSQTVMQMRLLYDSAVTQPMIDLGLNTETDQYFQEVDKVKEREESANALDKMNNFCETTAKPRFEKVKHIVDLSPLCEFGGVQEMKEHISEQINSRKQEVIQHLAAAQKILNPYNKNLGMTASKSEELAEAGEPKGLREIVGIFGDTPYYKDYLKFWKHNSNPSFVNMIKLLGKHVDALNAELPGLSQKIAEAKELLRDMIAKRKTATWILELAVDNKQLADSKLNEATSNLKAQQAAMDSAEKNLAELEDALERAQAAYKLAIKNLQVAYSEGVAMLQKEASTEAGVKAHMQLPPN